MARHHANGNTDDALVHWEFQETVNSIEAEAEASKTSYVSQCYRLKASGLKCSSTFSGLEPIDDDSWSA